MNATSTTESAALTTSGIVGVIAGAGVLVFALFPLAIPFLLLTAVFTAPLILIGIGAVLPVAMVAGLVLAIRGIVRRLGGRGGDEDRPKRVEVSSSAASPTRA